MLILYYFEYTNHRWTIQIRVANKKPIREFSNGDGRLFTCDLIDDTGEIRATGFGDECDRLEPMLIVGNVTFPCLSIEL